MRYSDCRYPQTIVRCQHLKVNGIQCGSPALKDQKFCYFHHRWHQKRIQIGANHARRARFSLDLPILEDANSIQVALMQGLRLLLTNQIDAKTAGLLFYALQTASSNLGRTKFEPRPEHVVIDLEGVPDTSLGDPAWYKEEFNDDEEEAQGQEEQEDNNPRTADIHAVAAFEPVLSVARAPSPAKKPAIGSSPRPRKMLNQSFLSSSWRKSESGAGKHFS